MLIATSFMALAALVFVTLPRPLVRLFSSDPQVIASGASLLLVAAWFQLADGIGVTATGALRGAGDTRSPIIVMLIGYWIVALPLGYQLCFRFGLGVIGLWIGLSVGLILVSLVLLVLWARRVRGLVLHAPTA
jgi:MATE family multidrug resistance protein